MNDKRQYYKTETIIDALRQSAGIVSFAAGKLGINRATLSRWISEERELQEACEEIREEMLDLSEAGLVQLIKDKDRESIRFYLRCKGKHRGWVEGMQVQGPNGGPVSVATTVLSRDEFRDLAKQLAQEV